MKCCFSLSGKWSMLFMAFVLKRKPVCETYYNWSRKFSVFYCYIDTKFSWDKDRPGVPTADRYYLFSSIALPVLLLSFRQIRQAYFHSFPGYIYRQAG